MPFPGLSSSGDQVFGERDHCDLSPPLSLPLGFLGVQPAYILRRMLTVQNPKKSLPTKVRLVKAMVFLVVMYGCESWTIKKAKELMLLNCGIGEDS